jgi:lysophospholipase L1-like esterase
MGDSVAAAPGVPDPTPPAGCRKSTNDYPSVLARRLTATKFTDVTYSGATTEDITRRAQQARSGAIARQIDAVGATTDLSTITIGANDAFVVGDVDRISAGITAQVPVWSLIPQRSVCRRVCDDGSGCALAPHRFRGRCVRQRARRLYRLARIAGLSVFTLALRL